MKQEERMRSKENLARLEKRIEEMEAELEKVRREVAEMKGADQAEKAEIGTRKKAAAKK